MAEESFLIQQQIFKGSQPSIRVDIYHENTITKHTVDTFLGTVVDGIIGVAPAYGPKCALVTLALSSTSNVLVIRFSPSQKSKKNKLAPTGRDLLQNLVLCEPGQQKYGFKIDKFAAALHFDLGLRINNGVDLLSATKAERHSLDALLQALGGELTLNKAQLSALFKDEEKTSASVRVTASQAWAACQAARLESRTKIISKVVRIHTELINEDHLNVLAKTIRDADRLTALKPTRVKNEVDTKFSSKKGNLELNSSRFKTRVMRTAGNQKIEIEGFSKGKLTKSVGHTTKVSGRAATVSLQTAFHGDKIRSVTTIGREALTSAESMREDVILRCLQRTSMIIRQPFVQRIFLPKEVPSWANTPSSPLSVSLYFPSLRPLNVSQAKAVNTILSNRDADRVTLIHGPPGTGKTTVIVAVATSIMASSDTTRTLWLVAQSNVAVKNMAEKLASVNFFDFKLLVSKDFHYDWHEHLYKRIEKNLIRSDDFVDDIVAVERLLLGSRVLLCTLSMLSNSRLATFVRAVPPQTMIFDEASQIEIGDYFPLLYRFQRTIRKLVFIGDDKQLAPYGYSDVDNLKSIFEMSHLRSESIFLDTQYRMPTAIGAFISRSVYNNRLKTVHEIKSMLSCRFINVNGKEQKMEHSWMNAREVSAAINIAKKLHALRKPYRIITAYDGQRSQLENALKAANIPWEDRCFNVDSFQGNEEDYIILSLVRSDKIGFMKEPRRMNVMLTRCKKGMIILTNRAFIESKASSSLVGGLAKALGAQAWLELATVLQANFNPFPSM